MNITNNMALLIPVDGEPQKLKLSPKLAEAQKLVEGYVEALSFTCGDWPAQALCNEDGLSKRMELNQRASVLVGRPLVGPVIILTGSKRWR